jgi:uncharacterized protein (TIGR00251 family)
MSAAPRQPHDSPGLAVRVTPRARRNEIAGARDGVVLVRVASPPEDGRANLAVRRLIATRLSLRLAEVTVIRGESSREKVILVEGMTGAQTRANLLGGDGDSGKDR